MWTPLVFVLVVVLLYLDTQTARPAQVHTVEEVQEKVGDPEAETAPMPPTTCATARSY